MTAVVATLPVGRHLEEPVVARWMRAHPRTTDWIVVLVCTSVQYLTLVSTGARVNWTVHPMLALCAFALLWRRRHPLGILTVVTVLAAAGMLVNPELTYLGLPSAFALFVVATAQSTGRAIMGYLIAIMLPALAGLILIVDSGARYSPSILDPLCLAALAAGFAVRVRRERRESLHELIRQRSEQAALTERARITAEMHDVVAHSITVMLALAGGAQASLDKYPQRAREALERLNDVGTSSLAEMQRILSILRTEDPALDTGLNASGHNVQSLDELAATFRSAGLPVTVSRSGTVGCDDPALATTIHRIVQEALTNALRYAANATEVHVALRSLPEVITLTISDDGHAAAAASLGTGMGLAGIHERAAAFGGYAASGPLPGGGWQTLVRIPKTPRKSP